MHNIVRSRRFRFLLLISAGIVLVFIGLVPKGTRAADSFTYAISVSYFVEPTGTTRVKESYNITNNTANQYLDSIKLSTPSEEVQNLKVYYTGGGSIPFSTEKVAAENSDYKYEYLQINVDFPRVNVGQNIAWGFVVEYSTSELVENKGNARVVYVPAIAPENYRDYKVSLSVPADFGPMHSFGKLPREVQSNNINKVYQFDTEDLVDRSVQLLFGDSATYQTNFNFPLHNNSGFPKVYEVTLPPTTASQTVYLNSLEPKPENIRIDTDNNIIATYTLQPQQKITVSTDVLAEVRYINYDLGRSGQLGEMPRELKERYTKPTKYWQSNNAVIRQKAEEITKDKSNVAEMVKSINDYVINNLSYNNEKIKYNIRQGSLEAFENPNNAVCLEYSDLTITLLRAAGIPARMPVGYGYSGDLKKSTAVSDSLHSWVEAYIPNVGWVNLDPTWGEKFNNFGVSDIDHFAFAIWGESDSEPVAITEASADINYQYENATLRYINTKPTVTRDASLQSTKFVILPLVSLVYYAGRAPSNAATFDLKYILQNPQGSTTELIGARAPGQSFWGFKFDLGANFSAAATAELTQPNVAVALSSARVGVNYLPMAGVVALVSILIIWKVVKLRRSKEVKHSIKEPGFYSESERPSIKK